VKSGKGRRFTGQIGGRNEEKIEKAGASWADVSKTGNVKQMVAHAIKEFDR